MTKVAIISGSGRLPLLIGENLIKKKYDVFFICLKNNANSSDYKKYKYCLSSITSFTKILNILKKQKISSIIMAGSINSPSVKDIKFDLNTLKLIKNYYLESKGDDQLLKTISNFFLKKGYPLFDWQNQCIELFSSKECLTKNFPKKKSILNKDKGLEVFSKIGKADIGQSIIVQNQIILGIECTEGTNDLIKRCYDYKKKGDNGILIKLSKYNQHSNLDLPTIGMETIKNLKKYKYDGIFFEKNKCIILDKNKMIDYCNHNDLFLASVEKN